MTKFKLRALKATLITWVVQLLVPPLFADNWTEWRGSRGDGIVNDSGFPREWSADRNILWATQLQAPGNSSPIVYEDRIFLTCANNDGTERCLYSFDRDSGKVLWTRAIPYKNDDPTHATNPWCAATPATDGKQVFVWNGSAGATAYDFEGNKLWHRDFGEFVHKWGHASSPRIYYDTVIYFGSPGPRVLLTALNKDTGETVWENHLSEVSSPPEENHGSFVTPYLWKNGVRDELLVPLPGQLASFDPRTGEKLWYCEGLGRLVYADAMLSEDLILAFSGFKGPAIGVRKPRSDETGNLTESHRIWINDKTVQRVGTGIVVGDLFFLCGRKGILQCGDVNSGEIIWEENLRSQAWGSILLQDGLLYLIDQKSETIVFEPADAFKLVARNPMNIKEQSNSTLAFSEGQIFLRTYRALYAIKGN